jgi:4-amino-4-deoxy-L-arabinose transferase-like glycosyltransferase
MRARFVEKLNAVESAHWGFVFIILLVAFSAITLTGLNGSLQNVDEVLYARVSRETLEHGSWLLQYKDGTAWFHKPPMVFWTAMLSYRLFGVSDFAAKLPSAIAGIVSAFLVLFISRALFHSLKAGIISALLYLTSIQVYFSTHQIATDSLLVMYLLSSLFFVIKGIEGKPAWFFLAGFFNAMVFLTKSVLGFVVPSALFIYIIIERRWELFFHFIIFFLISLGLSSPYFIYVYRKIPDIFVKSFLYNDVIGRFYKGSGMNLLQVFKRLGYGIAFYTVALILFALPFAAGLLFLFIRKNESVPTRDVLWGRTSKLISVFFLVALIGYSLQSAKFFHWGMPMIPAAILFLGYVLHSIRNKKIFLYSAFIAASALILLLCLLIFAGSKYPAFKDVFIGLLILYAGYIAANLVLYFKDARTGQVIFPLVIGFFIGFTIYTAVTVPCDFNWDIKSFAGVVYDDPSPLIVVRSGKVNEGRKRTVTVWYLKMWSENYESLDQFLERASDIQRGTYLIYYRDYASTMQGLYPSFRVLKKGKIWEIGRVE